jgi:hypothetical protein
MGPTEDQLRKYEALLHAMQTGVAHEHANGSADGSPKHLRVGVNAAMSDHAALARLLIAKGVITADEYGAAIIEGMQMEVDRYEKNLSDRSGGAVIKLR